jgi:cyanophycinase
MDGGALTLSYLRVGIVGAGYTFNLRERELETLLLARSANTATEVLRGGWGGGVA